MKKDKLKKYRVTLEFHIKEDIDVEAQDQKEAEHLALEQIEVPFNSIHYDTKILELR